MTKKLGERAIVEAFIGSRLVPSATLVEWERERPDALIRVDQRIVGVEVTALTEAVRRQPIAPQQWTVEAQRLVQDAKTAFESSNSRPLVVSFWFRADWVPPVRLDAARLATEFAAVVAAACQQLDPASNKPLTLVDPHPALCWAYIGNTPAQLGGRWEPSFGFEGTRASAQDIAATVARKEQELADYKRATPEVWLLIDCNVTGQGVALYPPETNFEIVTEFGRVFCCGFGRWEWVEVPCVPRGRAVIPTTG